MNRIYIWLLVAMTGCVIATKANAVDFEGFIEQQPGRDYSLPSSKGAYRIKTLSLRDRLVFEDAFRGWCQAQGAQVTYVQMFADMASLKGSFFEYPSIQKGSGCIKEKSMLGAYAYYEDTSVAFFTEWEANTARMRAEIVNKQRDETSRRNNSCRLEKTKALRANPLPGQLTNYGMVVEVKLPIVQLQTVAGGVPVLQWVEISRLEPPYGEYCN